MRTPTIDVPVQSDDAPTIDAETLNWERELYAETGIDESGTLGRY